MVQGGEGVRAEAVATRGHSSGSSLLNAVIGRLKSAIGLPPRDYTPLVMADIEMDHITADFSYGNL
jgi:hypothetical protein